MSKPLNENLRHLRIVDSNGDLRPLLDVAGERLAEVVQAVAAHGKAGSFVLRLDLKPSTAGALAIKPAITAKVPSGAPAEALLWPTAEGNLASEDPRQQKLELKPVETQERTMRSA